VGCGETPEAEQPKPDVIPTIPALEYNEGHLTVAQRGLPLDRYDMQVLPGMRDTSPEEISMQFGLLVLNLPLISWPASCAPINDGPMLLPAAKVAERIQTIRAGGVTIEDIAINVDILTPGRSALYHVCFAEGASEARFDVAEYRRQLVSAFTALAGVDGVKYVTVGIDMNIYYHAEIDGDRRTDDYTNWVLMYREIYEAMKAVNPDLMVGPGLNYTYFRGLTMDAVAAEIGLEKPASDANAKVQKAYLEAAAFHADKRTVEPFLVSGRNASRKVTADFLALSFMPFTNTSPYNGEPAPSDEAAQQEVLDWHLPLHTLSAIDEETMIPLVVAKVDWPEGALKRPKKAGYLATVKKAVSPFNVLWLSWQRFSDLPDPAMGSPCAQFTRASDEALRHKPEYCGSGIVDQYGTIEEDNSVFRTLVIEP